MDSIIEQLNVASGRWFAAMQLASWQAIVVFGFAWAVGKLFRRYGPAAAFWIWTIAAAKIASLVVLPMVLPVALLQAKAAQPVIVTISEQLEANDELMGSAHIDDAHRLPSATSALMMTWVAVVVSQLILILIRRRATLRMLAKTTPASTVDQRRLEMLRNQMRISHQVQLRRANVAAPLVTGIMRPQIILPKEKVQSEAPQSTTELEHVLLHELAHIKRHDLIWAWIPEFTRVLFFFHPVVYWIVREARLSREAACDQIAINSLGSASAYATTLLNFIQKPAAVDRHDDSDVGLAITGIRYL